jgi:hypothetical protein
MERLRALFTRKLEETRMAVARYQQLERELAEGLAYLEACRACATPDARVQGCVHCGQDHGMPGEPALVAGITSVPERGRRAGRGGLVHVGEADSR